MSGWSLSIGPVIEKGLADVRHEICIDQRAYPHRVSPKRFTQNTHRHGTDGKAFEAGQLAAWPQEAAL
jgi:hypothetical protein